jgi:GR25 family glycosyltransferase involved in LPS biosynthesis
VKTHLINLDRSSERLRAFRSWNSFLPDVERFSAIDGRALDRQALISQGVLDPRVTYTDGAIGCALSHIALWQRVVSEGVVTTIVEDDAVFNRHFAMRSAAVLGSLPAEWDCVLWGWNFDSVLVSECLPGVTAALMHFDQAALRSHLDRFQSLQIEARPIGLYRAFGTVCYTVTPQGAGKLLAACRPLRPLSVNVPGLPAPVPNNGIDVMMNAAYPQMKSFAAFPPLVVTPNERASSLVQ